MSIQANFPAIKPTLLLDFANTEALDPRITFTRASTGTYYDAFGVLQTAASGVPRFGHNPVTGESLGLLIEEQRTNLVTYSEQVDNAAWAVSGATVSANGAVAPDGTTTADKLVEDTATGVHTVAAPAFNSTISTAYTFSFYAKAAERNIAIVFDGAFNGSEMASFNLSTGVATILTVFGSNSASMVPVGNGWYRCIYTETANATLTGTRGFNRIRLSNGTTTSYAGNGFSGIYIWGAQLEAGAFATSYIPTVASQVTRAADSAVMTGANFSSWYRQDEGTVYMEADGRQPTVTFSNANAGYTNYRPFYRQPNQTGQPFIGSDINAGVTSSDIYAGSTNALPFRAAYAYANNNFAGSVNGLTAVTDNSGQPALAVNRMGIGFDYGANITLSGLFKKLAYYPVRVTNAQLQALTS